VLTNPSFIESGISQLPDFFFLQQAETLVSKAFQRPIISCMFSYIVLYKPYKVLCQFSRDGEKKTLADFFPDLSKNIYPVGRLDYDSEGLLLLTDDKQLTHQLLEPKFAHRRTYFVQVDGSINEDAIGQLQNGVLINVDGKQYKTKPAVAKILSQEPELPERDPPIRFRKEIPTSWLSLTLTEGKNRQVRKMTAAVNFPTLRLVRHNIGTLSIEGYHSGEHRFFGSEIKQLLLAR
jgi:23S rRNA pseudouridine2457 synthase